MISFRNFKWWEKIKREKGGRLTDSGIWNVKHLFNRIRNGNKRKLYTGIKCNRSRININNEQEKNSDKNVIKMLMSKTNKHSVKYF